MADPTPEKDKPVVRQQTREEILVAKLLSDTSATGAQVRKIARDLFPDAPIKAEDPESIVAPVKAEVEDLKTKLAAALDRISAREKADDDLKAENDLSVKLFAARKEFGLTESGYQKMLDRMKETGNFSDAQAAAAWVVSQMPKPAPANTPSWLPENSNLFGSQKKEEQWEALHSDPRRYLDDQLKEFVRDPDKYVNDTFGTT